MIGKLLITGASDPRPRSWWSPGRAPRPSELVGRDQDLSVIRAFVHAASTHGGTLLLCGEPGVGKSALLEAAAEIAATAGIRVLSAAGAKSEHMSFSGLNQVLLPLRADINRLDRPHRNALNVALGFSDGPASDPLVVSNAALALLCQSAADRPLLVIVDNLQWVDQTSLVVLGFVARRLTGSQVGLLIAERTAEHLSDLDVPGYEVPPIDDDASTRLVAYRFPDLAPAVRRRIVAEARGNSLALLELPAQLDDLQRLGLAALPAVLPLSRRLSGAFSSRVAALPESARSLLLLATLEGTGDLSLLRAAAAARSEVDDLVPAEQAGLVHVDESAQRVCFSHPLIRSAVMELAASGDVRRAHLALATHLADQPERRAWHLAAAAVEPDEGVASLLAHAARAIQDRGQAARAVTMLLRAAQLSPHHCDRSRRLAEAAWLSATVTGELSVVPRLLAESRRAALEAGGSSELDAEAELHATVAEARLLLNGGDDIGVVHRQLADAITTRRVLAAAPGPALTAMLHTLLWVSAASGRPESWEPINKALAGLVPGGCAELDLLVNTHADPARSAIGIISQLDAAIGDLSSETDHRRILVLGAAAACTDRLAGCREGLRRVASDGRDGGAVVPAISALTLLCLDGFLSGAWDEAWRVAEECLRVCQSHGRVAQAWPVRAHLAMIAAGRGEHERVRELTAAILRWTMPRGITLARMAVHRARALAALGRGDFEEAYREAASVSPPGILASHVPHALWAVMDLVEAAVRTGRPQEAAAHVSAVRDARIAEISPRLALLVTASAALAAPADEADQLFQQALSIRGADAWPFEFARVQLAFGEHLRRVRAPGDARVHLAAALATFRALEARPWADRAANELRAARLSPTKMESYRIRALTAQEQQIVTLAAAGLTNKQIGQRLFLSPRTVGSHLYRIFPKLGVSSRAALRDALVARASSASAPDAPALSRAGSTMGE